MEFLLYVVILLLGLLIFIACISIDISTPVLDVVATIGFSMVVYAVSALIASITPVVIEQLLILFQ